MRDDEPLPLPDDGPPPDPFEAELVAYLDGELDPADARRVESRLATDPDVRARAAALKKTFELLDHLPRPEPSPTFTSRTLERLPAVAAAQAPPTASRSATARGSLSMPVLLSGGAALLPPPPARWGLWAAAVALAVIGFAIAGYLAAPTIQHALTPAPPTGDPTPDHLPISDRELIENLPLYAAADDIDFVLALASPDYFGDDPAVAFDPNLKTPVVESNKPTGPAFEALAEAFKALPPARQQAIRELDRQLRSRDPRHSRAADPGAGSLRGLAGRPARGRAPGRARGGHPPGAARGGA
jgi:hypothetical protein